MVCCCTEGNKGTYWEVGLDLSEGISSHAIRDLELGIVLDGENTSTLLLGCLKIGRHSKCRDGNRKNDSDLGEVHLVCKEWMDV